MGHQSTWCHSGSQTHVTTPDDHCEGCLHTAIYTCTAQPTNTGPKALSSTVCENMTNLCRKVHAANSCCQNWHTKACNPKQQKLPLPSRPPPPIHSGSCAVSCRSRHSFSPLLPPNKNTCETNSSSQTGPGQYVWGPWSYGALEYGVIVKAASCHSQPPAKTKHSTVQSTISE
jgi:hypothetical protein